MTNDGVDPEHGFQQEQTTNPLRVCIVFFCKVESLQETAHLLKVSFLDCVKTACIYYSLKQLL